MTQTVDRQVFTTSGTLTRPASAYHSARHLHRRWRRRWLGSAADDGLGVGAAGAVVRSTGTMPAWSHPRVPTTAGPPSDADVIGGAGEAADGMLVLDTANERLYVRVGGTWRWAALT